MIHTCHVRSKKRAFVLGVMTGLSVSTGVVAFLAHRVAKDVMIDEKTGDLIRATIRGCPIPYVRR